MRVVKVTGNWFSGFLPQDSSPKYSNKHLPQAITVIDTSIPCPAPHWNVSSLREQYFIEI